MTNANCQDSFDLIIIGSGISGLTAASYAKANGRSCLVLDKGRRIGGRCSTKRSDGFTFNHGAQFFTCKDDAFSALTEKAIAAGAVSKWDFGHHAPAFAGVPTMRDFPQFMAQLSGFEVRQNITITQISKTEEAGKPCYHLCDSDGQSYQARALIITAPAPQAALLVAPLDERLAATARSASYDPCWTIMLGLDAPIPAHRPYRDEGIIGWANYEPTRDNHHYPPALTIQASPDASRDMLDWPADKVIATLTQAYEGLAGTSLSVRFAKSHRWLYARVATSAASNMPFISDDKSLVLAGDYFGNARLESAFDSGRRAAIALLMGL